MRVVNANAEVAGRAAVASMATNAVVKNSFLNIFGMLLEYEDGMDVLTISSPILASH
jgi:hypothetical protein